MESTKRSHERDDSKDQTNKRTSRRELTADDDSDSNTLVCDALDTPPWVWQRDHVDKKEKCTVSLWTRPLDAAALNKVLKLVKGREYSNTQVFDHWALVFHWENLLRGEDPSRAVTYEAGKKNYLLIPTWSEGYPKESNWRCHHQVEQEMMLSPEDINRAAEDLTELNGQQYDPVEMNCQVWVKALWRALKGESLDFEDLASSSFEITKKASRLNPFSS